MRNTNTDLRLAGSPQEWKSLTHQAFELVDTVTHHGEFDAAHALFSLLTLLTDTRVNASDREGLTFDVLQKVFGQTEAGQKALEDEMRRVNPVLLKYKAA